MDDLVVGEWVIPAADLDERFATSGGPGGQHANRNATAVRLRFDIAESSLPENVRAKLISRLGSVVEVTASEQRSQFRNREEARERLTAKIEVALTDPKPRRRTKRTRASKEKRLADKRARSDTKRGRRRPPIDD